MSTEDFTFQGINKFKKDSGITMGFNDYPKVGPGGDKVIDTHSPSSVTIKVTRSKGSFPATLYVRYPPKFYTIIEGENCTLSDGGKAGLKKITVVEGSEYFTMDATILLTSSTTRSVEVGDDDLAK